MAERLVNLQQAAALLRRTRRSLYHMMADGRLPYVQVGWTRRIPSAAIDEWIGEGQKGQKGRRRKERMGESLKVLLVTTWGTACGIAEHSAYLKESIEAVDPAINISWSEQALDPEALPLREQESSSILHLNYHRALHSRWQASDVMAAQRQGWKVIVTFHDTYGEHDPDLLSKDLCRVADAFIVHEPCLGLAQAIYWRMGVPGWQQPQVYNQSPLTGWTGGPRPILGTVGFPFPWKNYERLAEETAKAGWALLLIAPKATEEQVAEWRRLQPDLLVQRRFVPRREVVSMLAGCDATAFCYTCANSGQSGAVLQGVAARKPVFAFKTCRQFRALYDAYPGAVDWGSTFEDLAWFLRATTIERTAGRMVALAQQDSWEGLGRRYATLYRALASRRGEPVV